MRVITIFTFTIFLFLNSIIGQNTMIFGSIKDNNNSPLEFVLQTLYNATDSTIVKSSFSESNGTFSIDNIDEGSYYIQFYLLGYKMNRYELFTITKNQKEFKIPEITLVQESKELKEVTVSSTKSYIERKIDRTIVNVDALISNQGSNILEAMEKAPGIQVDESGLIKMKGRSGVAVYVDDKLIPLSGTELQSYLQAIPTSTIQRIELITNPPARYDASGNAGIINIVTKKTRSKGLNGNLSTGFTKGRYERNNNSLNLNLNINKWLFYTQLSGGFRNTFQDLNINRYYKNLDITSRSAFQQNSFIVKKADIFNSRTGVDFFLNQNNQIGISLRTQLHKSNNQTDNNAYISLPTLILLQNIKADNSEIGKFRNKTYNLYWKNAIGKKGKNIYADFDYATYNSTNNQIFKNSVTTLNDNLTSFDQTLGSVPTSIEIFGTKLDYVNPINDNSKWEAGLKFSRTLTDNIADYKSVLTIDTTPNYNLSNRFEYNEKIIAAYGSYSHQIGKVGLQFGLRAEHTQLEGYQYGNPIIKDSTISNQYLSLFPTFYASWNPDTINTHSFNFSYGRRIDRPFFQDLNPFISPLDKFTFYGGNPNLKPTFAHNLSFSHTFKSALTSSINYSFSDNNIVETLEIVDTIYYSRPGNVANNQQISLSVEGAYPFKKWWTLTAYVEGAYVDFKSKLYTENLHSNGYNAFVQFNNIFQFKNDWSAELRGDYSSDAIYSQLKIRSWSTLNFSIAKKILKSAATIKLSVNDIFYTRRADGIIYNLANTDADWNSRLDSRNVNINFSYRFGKALRNSQRNENTGSADEQKRVKN
ncbi:MAG: TonB-dependent receptor [Saprospiraceae bacterium]|nr:TonB-dependent receptor [Saprospiraceae bacterium]